ncbi:MAG: type II toxin-antitoxin system PemK/MazF family toxin [Chloroflexi bacterium]|nr:type II toxin-antitoxin system PemK/MazF family toxin [Chloroflexota bacterium]
MNRGEIWLVRLDPTIGAEIRKTRPALIVNDDNVGRLPLRIVAPITEWDQSYTGAAWLVPIDPDATNGLSKPSASDLFQVRSVSLQRFVRQLGRASASTMSRINEALSLVFAIDD